jgi:protease-4
MKNFWNTFLACLLALIACSAVALFFVFVFFAGVIASFSSGEEIQSIHSGSVLKIELTEEIRDNPAPASLAVIDPFSMYSPSISLLDVLNAIDRAAEDSRIEGIFLHFSTLTTGMATMEEIRGALLEFKESGKFVIAYSDYYTQGSYYLASVADKVYVNPEGGVDWRGLASTSIFFKGLLDKLGVEAEIYRVGEFKSAVEPFMTDKMSPENRQQTERLLQGIWTNLTTEIADSRSLNPSTLRDYATNLAVTTPGKAVELGLIDDTKYHDEMLAELASETESVNGPTFVALTDYIGARKSRFGRASKNRIALIYAEGEIVPGGESADGVIAGDALAEKLSEARRDDQVKAVILRVNSPGGSALASDVIWREMSLTQQQKPLIVSMGDYAASGGYYISCPADVILADKHTLTGSIGVFGLMFDLGGALRNKVGITTDVVATTPSGDLGSVFRATTPTERNYIQNSVNSVYETFVSHVAEGRNLSREEVLPIAGGRVWSGIDANKVGLVDGHGGLRKAIELAADRAGISDDYRVVVPQDPMDQWTILLNSLFTARATPKIDPTEAALLKEYRNFVQMLKQDGVQARMPYTLRIE